MRPFFPTPYEDELLYSLIARYHFLTGNSDYKDTLVEVFGSRSKIPSIHFPTNIGYLCAQFYREADCTPEQLVFNHTLFPLYSPFLPKERAVRILNLMISDAKSNVQAMIGMMAGSVCSTEGLLYCPICADNDFKDNGEMYFRRSHNVQGVSVCYKHGCLLKHYRESYHIVSRIEFIRFDHRIADLKPEFLSEENIQQKLHQVAESVHHLLNHHLIDNSQVRVHQMYLHLMNAKGFLTSKGHISQQDLAFAIYGFYGGSILSIMESGLGKGNEYNWLKVITRKPKRVVHPIRHILLMMFLSGSAEEFFRNDFRPVPVFGEPPWYCLNPAAEHFRQPVVVDCKISADYKTRKPVGTFACHCGFVYSRRGPDLTPEDKYRIGRIKNFGPVWEAKLHSLLKKGNVVFREIGRIMNCDPNTIVKYAHKLGLAEQLGCKIRVQQPVSPGPSKSKADFFKRYAKDITVFLKENPECCRTEMRFALQKQYAWFYRNNPDWLEEHLPPPLTKKLAKDTKVRVDWKTRDIEILFQLKGANHELLSLSRPVRITSSRLAKSIGQRAVIQRHIDKLPRTADFLEKVSESVSEFQRRRIVGVTKEIFQRKGSVKKWEVIREAGIRPEYLSNVESFIQDDIQRIQLLIESNSILQNTKDFGDSNYLN
ncbi:TnsD family Tn7-like transposition protein [Desulfosporosinus sp. Sb-LF]|uniref:TnsD family Tn7-like transposition protein n=1 Tax=Desulfosporosinus sp. Sb-LF TaxID=2560027 RepID=UPI00107EFC9D|nr:TnsD family Tn7-like transposition protein [Desulfosporosinus sp. Sb-LF]TGE32993.1 hypothetical protein E4K68_09110 [Desulfosporosinus sp. Sb-LF]